MNLDGARVAVIGGAGFIGSHLVDHLLREQVAEVRVIDNFVRGKRENLPCGRYVTPIYAAALASRPGDEGDSRLRIVEASITDRDAVRYALAGVDGVFLLASLWLDECERDPRAAWQTNVLGTYEVVETCKDLGVKRIVYSSSASVYGNARTIPMTEDHPLGNRTTYGATKIACEQMLLASGIEHASLRYMNVYGPRMDDRGAYVSVVLRAIDRVLKGECPIIFGDGSQTFDFVYVEDVARANVLAMKADDSITGRSELTLSPSRAFNVGTGVGTSVKRLVEVVLEVMGSDLEPEYRPAPDGARGLVTKRIGSTERARDHLGFIALTLPLHEGIEQTVAWRRVVVR